MSRSGFGTARARNHTRIGLPGHRWGGIGLSGSGRGIVVATLTAFASIYVLADPQSALVVGPILALQLIFVWQRSPGLWLPILQTPLVLVAILHFETSTGILGFLGGTLLLMRLWPLAPLAVGASLILASDAVADAAITVALISLVIFGLTHLTHRADEALGARVELAAAAVTRERMRLATELHTGLGHGLDTITHNVRQALADPTQLADLLGTATRAARRALADAREAAVHYRTMPLGLEISAARSVLNAAGVSVEVNTHHTDRSSPEGALLAALLRHMTTEILRTGDARTCVLETSESARTVRLTLTDDGAGTATDDGLYDLVERFHEAGGELTVRLSPAGRRIVTGVLSRSTVTNATPAADSDNTDNTLSIALLTAVLVGFSAMTLLELPVSQVPAALGCLALIVFLQLRSVRGRHMWALTIMAFLAYGPIFVFGSPWLGVSGFLAGPILLAFAPVVAWPLVVVVVAGTAAAGVILDLPAGVTANYALSTLVTGLVIYGLLRLTQVVTELREAREELAQSAIVEERLRAARDLHDLLGHSLAAILLKCELARRVEPPLVHQELREVLDMSRQAKADMRTVSGEAQATSLMSEAESARSVLTAAGVAVELTTAHDGLAPEAEAALSAALRESVTNVLRHSRARSCTITTVSAHGGTRLRVRNDNAGGPNGRRAGSSGIANLRTRLAVLEGTLTTQADDDWFEIEAWIP